MEAATLISRCKAGERQALHQFYEQYRPRLLSICRQYTKGDDVAEDLLHDAFVVILTSLDQLRDADKLESWMTSIVRNVGFHYREHLDKEQAALQQMVNEKIITEETMLMPDYEQLQSLVTQLPEGYQQVFRLSVFEGLSHQEISQLLGIAPHSSSSQLSHAKRMLQALIRQSWIFILLLIAIPTAVWKLLHKPKPETKPTATAPKPQKPQTEPIIDTPHDKPIYTSIDKRPSHTPIRYRTEAVSLPDSLPYYSYEKADTLTNVAQVSEKEVPTQDTLTYQQIPLPSLDDTRLFASTKSRPAASWNIKLAYSGQIGQRDDYLAATTIGNGSFYSTANTPISTGQPFDNWIGYNYYLSNSPEVSDDVETRSLINIATWNSAVNGGNMEAHYEHQLPVTFQLMLSRKLSKRLSLEVGLSYTRLSSTTNTGSSQAYIQEHQRLHYLGIPLRFGWQWYSKAHLSLYSSAGTMLELPISGATDINHIYNGTSTFHDKTSLSVPVQWSASFGLGVQYDLIPHLGIYAEPSLQYFFDDGSDLKTYRTEHPLQFTFPLGIRFHW